MTQPVRTTLNRLIACTLTATPLIVAAAAGEFTFVTGDVTLTKAGGQKSTPVRGTPVDLSWRPILILAAFVIALAGLCGWLLATRNRSAHAATIAPQPLAGAAT